MSNTIPPNFSNLFKLFDHDTPDRTGIFLQRIGKISFSINFIAVPFILVIKDRDSVLYTILVIVFGASFFGGLLAFLATGIHYIGQEKHKSNFLTAMLYVLKKTFLYIFLPTIVITAGIVLWAIATKQPAFR